MKTVYFRKDKTVVELNSLLTSAYSGTPPFTILVISIRGEDIEAVVNTDDNPTIEGAISTLINIFDDYITSISSDTLSTERKSELMLDGVSRFVE